MRILLVSLLLCLAACSTEVQNKTGQVLDNAGGIIKGSKQEVNKQWQPANKGSTSNQGATDSEEEIQKRRRY